MATPGLRIEQTGIELVPVIEGHPAAVEVKALRADIARLDLWKNFLAVNDRAVLAFSQEARDVAVALGALDEG